MFHEDGPHTANKHKHAPVFAGRGLTSAFHGDLISIRIRSAPDLPRRGDHGRVRPSPSRQAHANTANLVLKGAIFEFLHSLWVHEAARAFEGATNARPGTLFDDNKSIRTGLTPQEGTSRWRLGETAPSGENDEVVQFIVQHRSNVLARFPHGPRDTKTTQANPGGLPFVHACHGPGPPNSALGRR